MNEQEKAKKMKQYLHAAKKASKGSKRGKKKLRKMAENDIITILAKGTSNHPAWYTKLGAELVGLNYGGIDLLGNRTDLCKDGTDQAVILRTTVDVIIPIILSAPCDETLRVAAQKIVNELRLVSGANTVYDVDDMIDYLLNIRSIWAALTQIRRGIRALNVVDPYDQDAWRKYLKMNLYYVGAAADTPSGMDTDFRARAAGIINWINTITKAVRFMMPLNLSLFERTKWMFENVFVDGTGKKFGTKMFVAPNVPYYSHTGGSTTHTAIRFNIFGPNTTVDSMLGNVEAMINDFTTKQVNVAIAGDLMKAYGMASFYDPGKIEFTEKIPFIYDERALEQIANLDLTGERLYRNITQQYDGSSPSVVMGLSTGDSPTLNKACANARTASWHVKLVNTDDNVVEGGETLSLTRLKTSVEYTYDASDYVTQISVIDCGTEVVRDYLYTESVHANGLLDVSNLHDYEVNPTLGAGLRFLASWAMDDYGPCTPLFQQSGANRPGYGAPWYANLMWDMKNWALMSVTEQHQLHRTAILSLFMPTASVIQQATSILR